METMSSSPIMHAPGPVTAVLDDTPMSDMIEDHAEWLEQALSTSNDMHTQRPVENSPGTGDFDEFSFLMNTNFGFVDQPIPVDELPRPSPLFRLPFDIRQRILIHIIGNKTLHLSLVEAPAQTGQPRPAPTASAQGSHFWRFCICSSNIPERAAFRVAAGLVRVPPSSHIHWTGRHTLCFTCTKHGPIPAADWNDPVARKTYPLGNHGPHQLNAMNILLSCRALTTEALEILYGHNTFAFGDPKTLAAFLDARTSAQRAAITQLAILPAQVHVWRAARDSPAIAHALATPLPALQSVHIDIEWQDASGPERRAQRMLRDHAFLERRLRGILALGPLVSDARERNPNFRCFVTFVTNAWQLTETGMSIEEEAANVFTRDQERLVARYVHRALMQGGSSLPHGEAMLAHRYGSLQKANVVRHMQYVDACKRAEAHYHTALEAVARAPKARRAAGRVLLANVLQSRPRGWTAAGFSDVSDNEG